MNLLSTQDLQSIGTKIDNFMVFIASNKTLQAQSLEAILAKELAIIRTASETDQLDTIRACIEAIRSATKNHRRKAILLSRFGKRTSNKHGVNDIIWGSNVLSSAPKLTDDNLREFKNLLGLVSTPAFVNTTSNPNHLQTNQNANPSLNSHDIRDVQNTQMSFANKQDNSMILSELQKDKIRQDLKHFARNHTAEYSDMNNNDYFGINAIEPYLKDKFKYLDNQSFETQKAVITDAVLYVRAKSKRVLLMGLYKSTRANIPDKVRSLFEMTYGDSFFGSYPEIDINRFCKILELRTSATVNPVNADISSQSSAVNNQQPMGTKAPMEADAKQSENQLAHTENIFIKALKYFVDTLRKIANLFRFASSEQAKVQIVNYNEINKEIKNPAIDNQNTVGTQVKNYVQEESRTLTEPSPNQTSKPVQTPEPVKAQGNKLHKVLASVRNLILPSKQKPSAKASLKAPNQTPSNKPKKDRYQQR